MKNTIIKSLIPLAAVASLAGCMSTGPHLTSSISEGVAGLETNLPYANYAEYFGYVDASAKADGKVRGKDAYYLYLWVPAAVDEIGVSMMSPAEADPSDSDFVQKNFAKLIKSGFR